MDTVLPYNRIDEMISCRNAAIRMAEEAANQMAAAREKMAAAQELARKAHHDTVFHGDSSHSTAHFDRLFAPIDVDMSVQMYRRHVDCRTWVNVLTQTGIYDLMDSEARKKFREELSSNPAEVNRENLEATAKGLQKDARLIFLRGLANAFMGLDPRFKSHDAFKIGSRIILTDMFNCWGMWNSYKSDTFADLERVFCVLDGKKPEVNALKKAVCDSRQGFGARQSSVVTEYFKVRTFKNGNAHLWFTRDDLVEKANKCLAEFYGEVLPDAVGPDTPEKDFASKSGALCKDLSFYPTPERVIQSMLHYLHGSGLKVLEPSAGTGNITKILLEEGHTVEAVEVDPGRVQRLKAIQHGSLTVYHQNFLKMTPKREFDAVVMNPPFYGTHYMEHVEHAYRFLKDRGTLVSVLPYSVRTGTTKKHIAFRKWVKQNHGRYVDLPSESFAESGTRVNTTILNMGY